MAEHIFDKNGSQTLGFGQSICSHKHILQHARVYTRSTRSMREHAPPEEMQAEDAATDAGQARCTQSTHKTQKKHGKEGVSKRQYAFQTLHKGSPHFLPRRSIVGGQIVFSKMFSAGQTKQSQINNCHVACAIFLAPSRAHLFANNQLSLVYCISDQ